MQKNIAINTEQLCSYGCGKQAKFLIGRQKTLCCSKSINSCDIQRKKNSQGCQKSILKGKKVKTIFVPGFIPFNKGKTLEQCHGKEKAERIRLKIKNGMIGKSTGKCSDPVLEKERKLKIGQTAKVRKNTGGYRKGSGRGKKGWYKGFFCDSSWELAWVIYYIDHGIKFERNLERFEYEYNKEKHFYIPDFKRDNTFVEVKGFKNGQFYAKMQYFPEQLTIEIYDKKRMEPILSYVNSVYGFDYIKLYEKKQGEMAESGLLRST